jgi:hypothetical protein
MKGSHFFFASLWDGLKRRSAEDVKCHRDIFKTGSFLVVLHSDLNDPNEIPHCKRAWQFELLHSVVNFPITMTSLFPDNHKRNFDADMLGPLFFTPVERRGDSLFYYRKGVLPVAAAAAAAVGLVLLPQNSKCLFLFSLLEPLGSDCISSFLLDKFAGGRYTFFNS